jgi:hypothetical protein
MTKPSFRQSDLERAIRGVRAVGETVCAVEINPDGKIRVLTTTDTMKAELSPAEAWEIASGHRAS